MIAELIQTRNSLSKELNQKCEYLRYQYDVDKNDYQICDAIRQVPLDFSFVILERTMRGKNHSKQE